MSVAVPTHINKLSFSAHFAWDLAACTSFSLSWSCTGPAPRNLLCRQIADLPFQAVGRESAESPQNVALESPRRTQASAWAGPPTICRARRDGADDTNTTGNRKTSSVAADLERNHERQESGSSPMPTQQMDEGKHDDVRRTERSQTNGSGRPACTKICAQERARERGTVQ